MASGSVAVGTLFVGVSDGDADYDTRVEDPAIQDMEIIASWDAEQHIPARRTADVGPEDAPWHVGGPVWRERRVKEDYARRFPDALGINYHPIGFRRASANGGKRSFRMAK